MASTTACGASSGTWVRRRYPSKAKQLTEVQPVTAAVHQLSGRWN
jgi:hypothetical protein